jgi:hypothetical protein
MDNFDLKKYLTESKENIQESSSSQMGIIKQALSKYKNMRSGEGDPIDMDTYDEILNLLSLL